MKNELEKKVNWLEAKVWEENMADRMNWAELKRLEKELKEAKESTCRARRQTHEPNNLKKGRMKCPAFFQGANKF